MSDKYQAARAKRDAFLGEAGIQESIEKRTDLLLAQSRPVYRQQAREEVLKAACTHAPEFTKYHPDPSGNNDSWTECLVCGAVLY